MNRDPLSPWTAAGAVFAAVGNVSAETLVSWLGYALIFLGIGLDWHLRRRWHREDLEADRQHRRSTDARLDALEQLDRRA